MVTGLNEVGPNVTCVKRSAPCLACSRYTRLATGMTTAISTSPDQAVGSTGEENFVDLCLPQHFPKGLAHRCSVSFFFFFLAALGLRYCVKAFSSWASEGSSSLLCVGFSLRWLLSSWSTRSRAQVQ